MRARESLGGVARIAISMVSFVLVACGGAADETPAPEGQEPESTETANTAAARREGTSLPIQGGGGDIELGRDTPGPSGERSSGNGFERPPE